MSTAARDAGAAGAAAPGRAPDRREPAIVRAIKAAIPRGLKEYVGTLVHPPPPPPRYEDDFTPEEVALCERVEAYTMTPPESVVVLARAVEYLVRRGVPGAFVECGVWRGGSVMTITETLRRLGAADRDVVLFDTFEGMTPPTDRDRDRNGRTGAEVLAEHPKGTDKDNMWCIASEEDVRANVGATRYPPERVRYVRGRVEDTLPAQAPDRIALLRLDTDWYESTKHELETCWDRISPGGVLVLDDYGLWQGQRDAADEFFAARGVTPLLTRMDYKARLVLKEAEAPAGAHDRPPHDPPTRNTRP